MKSLVRPSGSRGMEALERPAGFRSENPSNGNASEGEPAMGNQRWKSSDGHRIWTHSTRASVNRCLKSPREQRAWIRRQRRIGATDSGSAQNPEVERGDLEARGSQGRQRFWWNMEEWRTKQQREG